MIALLFNEQSFQFFNLKNPGTLREFLLGLIFQNLSKIWSEKVLYQVRTRPDEL